MRRDTDSEDSEETRTLNVGGMDVSSEDSEETLDDIVYMPRFMDPDKHLGFRRHYLPRKRAAGKSPGPSPPQQHDRNPGKRKVGEGIYKSRRDRPRKRKVEELLYPDQDVTSYQMRYHGANQGDDDLKSKSKGHDKNKNKNKAGTKCSEVFKQLCNAPDQQDMNTKVPAEEFDDVPDSSDSFDLQKEFDMPESTYESDSQDENYVPGHSVDS